MLLETAGDDEPSDESYIGQESKNLSVRRVLEDKKKSMGVTSVTSGQRSQVERRNDDISVNQVTEALDDANKDASDADEDDQKRANMFEDASPDKVSQASSFVTEENAAPELNEFALNRYRSRDLRITDMMQPTFKHQKSLPKNLSEGIEPAMGVTYQQAPVSHADPIPPRKKGAEYSEALAPESQGRMSLA